MAQISAEAMAQISAVRALENFRCHRTPDQRSSSTSDVLLGLIILRAFLLALSNCRCHLDRVEIFVYSLLLALDFALRTF